MTQDSEAIKTKYQISKGIIIVLALIILGYVIYSQIYKSNLQKAYTQGQDDASSVLIYQIWNNYLIPYLRTDSNTNRTYVDYLNAGKYWSIINNQES